MARLEAEIYDLAGERFNLGSPKQLGEYICSAGWACPRARRPRPVAWSPGQRAQGLAETGNTSAARILDRRELSKLKSTYTDALPGFVNKATQCVHTSYALAATTTGRLSPSESAPGEHSRAQRGGPQDSKAFVAEPAHAR